MLLMAAQRFNIRLPISESDNEDIIDAQGCSTVGLRCDGTVLHAQGWVDEDDLAEFQKRTDEIDRWKSIGLSEDSAVFEF